MHRVVEPELMNDEQQAQAYAAADFASTDAAFVDAFLERFGATLDSPIADLGCGPGNITLRLAQARPGLTLVGYDGAPAMLRLAAQRVGARPNVSFERATFPAPGLPRQRFAGVLSNSLLHHLHDPSVLWRTIEHIGRPGCPVFVGDLRRPRSPEELETLVDRYAGDAPDVLRRDFAASLHAAFEPSEVEDQLAHAKLEHLRVEAVGDRHLWVSGRL